MVARGIIASQKFLKAIALSIAIYSRAIALKSHPSASSKPTNHRSDNNKSKK
ncbi:MAG: hypothetical protein QNJ65_00440 [Xenococcaceae cyanobacterium MO_234.B1]|nr:hypothetical protein [Xenococcaceae cyanobacterium MO_234.B1]